jgi:hypothetical protein
MGRQIHFHMLRDDQNAFMQMVKENDPVVVTPRDDPKNSDVRPVEDLPSDHIEIFCLWNRRLLPVLKRESVGKAQGTYYMADLLGLPLLEFSPSLSTKWEGKPGLIQGRLYGQFDPNLNKPPEFEKWYERLVRWIRKNYRRHPSRIIGGYVGPAAYEFYENGGYLLPNFLPPRTDAWLAELGKQHPIGAPSIFVDRP